MTWTFVFVSSIAVAAASWALTGLMLRVLTRKEIMDRPNARSSHNAPKPRGGGLAVVPIVLLSWLGAALWFDVLSSNLTLILIGAVGLALMSWRDDLKSLPALPRILAHAIAVAVCLYGARDMGPVFQGLLPPLWDRLLAGLIWLWFINLFNFMDGIDGISGVESGAIGIGLFLTGVVLTGLNPGVLPPLLLAAASIGFLVWNWPPSKLFLGDVGSVPLGFLLGWLLLAWAAQGYWAAAAILPAYYFADATITLARRALRGAKVWHAHREHFYQRAVQGGASHAQVTRGVLICNAVLIGCALFAEVIDARLGLLGAGLAVAGFLWVLARWARRAGAPG
jgi:UDP-N-acetylmuramyl pentapeptide phosphotransferase/UDP-N-acetylglucosamine-1-phosphate transferase